MNDVKQKLKDLQELNKNNSVPTLASTQQNLQQQFQKAASMGKYYIIFYILIEVLLH